MTITRDSDIADILFCKLKDWAEDLGLAAERRDTAEAIDFAERALGLARKLRAYEDNEDNEEATE